MLRDVLSLFYAVHNLLILLTRFPKHGVYDRRSGYGSGVERNQRLTRVFAYRDLTFFVTIPLPSENKTVRVP